MKRITFILILQILSCYIFAQTTITPSVNSEFCPGTDYTFTVTVPGSQPQVSSWTGSPILIQTEYDIIPGSGNVTFKFKGRFRDANESQTFRISYRDANNNVLYFEPPFKRIRSLFFSTSCGQVSNQTPFLAPRCQIVNIPISVNNVQWGTFGESPQLCFGSISDFEYFLPQNWSIGLVTSNGLDWIAGGNNVVVTSDASNGVNGAILVRPRSNCGGNFVNGQVPGQIPINRPAPNLIIPEQNEIICSGDKIFNLNGLPDGATTIWDLSNANASLSEPSNVSVKVTRETTINTKVILTATVTHCDFTYEISTEIVLGTPSTNYSIFPFYGENQQFCANYFGNTLKIEPQNLGDIYVEWTSLNLSQPYQLITVNPFGGVEQDFLFNSAGTYQIAARTGNVCGLGDYSAFLNIEVSENCMGLHQEITNFRIYPTPSSGTIHIESLLKGKHIQRIAIMDKMGNMLKEFPNLNVGEKATINYKAPKPDVYIIKIYNGETWESIRTRMN
jgi:hypothetical protein